VFVRWLQASGPLDSYVRSADPAALVEAIERVVPEQPIPTKTGAAA